MECALSGKVTQHPVITRSGHVFEKALILKHLEVSGGTCPITKEPLSPQELIEVKVNPAVKPRPATAAHLPELLTIFQNEWDASALEAFHLKQQLGIVRQELAHSLYQLDAAQRVIARLLRERDEARETLARLQPPVGFSGAKADGPKPMEEENLGVTAEIVSKITRLSEELGKERQKRKVAAPSQDTIAAFKQTSSQNTHKAAEPGLLCLDIHPTDNTLIITGGVDKTAVLYNQETKKKVHTLLGHSKKVTAVKFHPKENAIYTASADKTVRIWTQRSDGIDCSSVVSVHSGPVSALDVHPTGDFLLSASHDRSWALHDVHTGHTLTHVANASADHGIASAMFHPDGILTATTNGNNIKVWDVRKQQEIANFSNAHTGLVASLCFSENGYQMVSGSSEALHLWDLRSPAAPVHSFAFESDFNLSSVSIDWSGKYVAAAGNEIRIFATRKFVPVASLKNHSQTVTGVKWAKSGFIASTSLDRSFKTFGSA
mmetsp:Transcript_20377/g.33969  ORF Transcript_20377/g.33969 Transcript_20377/m.33969 type:complete len:490 (+) Transcript_20377:71-1540(+)